MTGQVSRRRFLCQSGIYIVSIAVLGERAVHVPVKKRKLVEINRVVYESLAKLLQLHQFLRSDEEYARVEQTVQSRGDTMSSISN